MIVKATIKLKYRKESIARYEGLYMILSFKAEGEWINNGLEKRIITTRSYLRGLDEGDKGNLTEYYDLVEYMIDDKEMLIKMAEEEIVEHYEKAKKEMSG